MPKRVAEIEEFAFPWRPGFSKWLSNAVDSDGRKLMQMQKAAPWLEQLVQATYNSRSYIDEDPGW